MAQSVSNRLRTLLFINLIVTSIAANILSTALTVAIAPICDSMQISLAAGQWLTSVFSLAMAIIMPLTAYLITRFPTRKLYLFGLILFIISLAAGVFAPSFEFLIGARILQAMSGGLITAMAQVILLSIYPNDMKGTIMGWYGLAIGVSPIIAPTVAGIIIDLSSWRWIFALSLGIAILSFVLALFIFRDVLETSVKKFDVISFVLSIFGFGGITFGAGNMSSYGFTAAISFVPFVIGAIALTAFVLRQLKLETPFLELRVLKQNVYRHSLLASCLLFFVVMGTAVLLPIYSQSILGASATVSGLILLPSSIASAVMAPFGGKIYDKVGIRKLFLSMSIVFLFANVTMIFVTDHTSVIVIALNQTIRSVASGALMMPLVTWAMSCLPITETAHGSALLNTMRNIASALGIAIMVGLMSSLASFAPAGVLPALFGYKLCFVVFTVISVLMLLQGIFFVKDAK